MTSAASDGTEDDVDQGCCTDRCTGACGGYGFAFELAARNARDGIEGARPIGTWIDETHAFTSDSTEEPFTEGEIPLSPTMPSFSPFGRDEALRRITREDEELLRRLAPNDGPVDGSSVE